MGKKQKSRQGRKERSFESDVLVTPTLRLNADPALKSGLTEEEAVLARETFFSTETIQHLIERIKSI